MKRHHLTRVAGFSLVEVAVALGIVAFCIVPIVGLLGVGFNSNQSSIRQTSAATIASAISADLKATSPTVGVSPYFGLAIPAAGTSSTTNLYVQDDLLALKAPAAAHPTFLATVVINSATWNATGAPSSAASSTGTLKAGYARILITWPALANQAQVPGIIPTQYAGSMETIVGLDPN